MKTRETNSVVNNVVIAFKEHRELIGMTPYRLSLTSGVSKSSITKIERLEQNPTLSMLIKLSQPVEFDLPEVLKQNYPYPDSFVSEQGLLGRDPLFDLSMAELKKLSPSKLKLAYKILTNLVEETKNCDE